MTLVYFGSIVFRYAFNSGIVWAEEFTRYMNVALVMLGSATVARYNGHTNVSILETAVPKKIKKWVIVMQQLFTGAFFSAAFYFSLKMIELAGSQVSSNMRIPMRNIYSIFTVAFSILVFQVIVHILNTIKEEE
jgi:TRAP-type C4-dicarboxylate transport system permease small subunit